MNYWNIDSAAYLSGYELKTFLNKKRIIKSLYLNGELSGAEFSRLLHVSAPTVISYLNELVDEGYIENRGKGDSFGGRKPSIYGLKKNSVYVVGVDIGRKFLNLAVFNSDLEKVSGYKISAVPLDNKEVLLDQVSYQVNKMLNETNIDLEKVMGIGVSMPGLINSDGGINYTYLYDENETLADAFQRKFQCPVYLENDTKARTMGEMRYGAAKESNNALVIQIDWGLGLGMILNGRLYKGNSGFAGEFSHIPIEENGVLCNCGKVGCLETLASGNALVRLTLQGLENHANSRLFEVFQLDKDSITPALIIRSAHEGDHFAMSMINEVGTSLGKGIAYLIQILNPELVIIGGLLSEAREYLVTPIMQSLYKYCLPKVREDCDIVLSSLGDDAGVVGAATVVLENILDNN